MKRLRADKIEVVKFTTWVMILSAVYFLVWAIGFEGGLTMIPDSKNWLLVLGLALWSTMVSNFTGVKAVRRIGPTLTSIFGALQPLTAVVLGFCYLDEHLGVKTILGIVIIMIAVGIVVTHHKSRTI